MERERVDTLPALKREVLRLFIP